ncbi:phosphopantetheine-binding protein [Streptomyces sp. NPDC051014]|uniref:phosphopantetheine-binding protein n=1 Tax=Streptomyces sp. NPDC051014 TaxID=3155751 RepID=UPI0033F251AF
MTVTPLEAVTAEVAAMITEITSVVLPKKPLRDLHLVDDLDIDSLSLVEVVVAVETEYDIKIKDSEVRNLKTLGQVGQLVIERRRETT